MLKIFYGSCRIGLFGILLCVFEMIEYFILIMEYEGCVLIIFVYNFIVIIG